MAFLQQAVGKGVCVCALASTSVDISGWVSMQLRDQTCVVTCLRVSLVSVCVHGGEARFYSHIYIHMPSLYSTLLPKNGPQLSLFPVHPQRSYSWQKTHQVGRTTDNWGDDRSCSKTIDSDGDRRSGELSRLTELSGGSGSARPECGRTRSRDAVALLAGKVASPVCHLFKKLKLINKILC